MPDTTPPDTQPAPAPPTDDLATVVSAFEEAMKVHIATLCTLMLRQHEENRAHFAAHSKVDRALAAEIKEIRAHVGLPVTEPPSCGV